jgi:hypothetical protein
MSPEERATLATSGVKSVSIHLDDNNKEYSLTYKGANTLTLIESLKMWGYMTDWLLTRSDELSIETGDDVRKAVLSSLVKKITHECEVARKKEQEEESLIITP